MSGLVQTVEPLPARAEISVTEAFFSGRNVNTLDAYQSDLQDFAEYLGLDLRAAAERLLSSPQGAANALALTYRGHLIERDLSAATINRRLSALRSLVKMANTIGLVPWRLEVGNIRTKSYRDTRGPARKTFDEALRALDRRGDAKGRRDGAILHLLHDLGLRRHEVIGLDLCHLDLTAGLIWIVGKGSTERESLTLPTTTAQALAAWLKVRGTNQGPLFPNVDRARQGNGRLTGRGLHKICRLHGFRPHGLRHLAITEALDLTNGDARAVKRFSRHSRIETVLIYDDNRADMGGQIARMIAGEI